MWRRAATLGLLVALVLASGASAYRLLFSRFSPWDDEGYFLLALRSYQEGRGLYERIESIYGPFYFQFVSRLFSILRVPLDNDGARWFVLGSWIVSCLAVHRYVRRVTASAFAALLAYVLSFAILDALVNEPLHPGGLIVLLLSALLLVSLGLEDPARRRASLLACGALTAAIALTKLNVGCFVLLAFAMYFLHAAPRNRAGLALRIGAAVLLPALPFVWMAPLLGQEGFRGFAVMISLALLPFGFLPRPESRESWLRSAVPYALGGLASTIVVLALLLLGGTGWNALWHALVLDSLRFVGSYVYPPLETWSAMRLALAAIPITLGALVRWTSWLGPAPRALLKLAGGLVLLAVCLTPAPNPMLGLPLVWLVAVPRASSKRGFDTRVLLGFIVVLQSLHAYPVAGSQAGFFSFLLPIAGAVTVWGAFRELPLRWREASNRLAWKVVGTATVLGILATWHSTALVSPLLWTQFERSVPLALPGAESLRLPEYRAAVLQWVACNLRHHADTFLGFPGMHSFYGWTALRPPVPSYPHTWVLFSDDAEQEKLLQALLASERPSIVRNRSLIDFWMGTRPLRAGPLVRAADQDFRVAGAVGDYELLIPRDSQPDLVLSAVPTPAPQELLDRYRAEGAIRLAFPAMPGIRVARIVVRNMRTGLDVFDSAADSSARRLTILSLGGAVLLGSDPPASSGGMIDLSERSDVLMLFPPTTAAISSRTGLVRAYDEQGEVVARLLMPVEARGR